MTTIKDIANAAGVSIATVSRVINDGPKVGSETRRRVRQVVQDLGYRPNAAARALVTKDNLSIGVVVPELSDPFYAALAHGIESVCKTRNLQFLLSSSAFSAEGEEQAIKMLVEHRCQAIVVHSQMLDAEALLKYRDIVPGLVLINRYIPDIAHQCVWLDNELGGRIMAQFMLSHGHRQFAAVMSNRGIDDPVARLKGIRDKLRDTKIDLADSAIEFAPPDQEGGEAAMQSLIAAGGEFSAVLCYNDAMAVGAISTLRDHGLDVPADVSVIGFDNLTLAKYCYPKLTTLSFPIEIMAAKAAELALQLLSSDSDDLDRTYKFSPALIERDSVSLNG